MNEPYARADSTVKLLVFSSLYPSRARPRHGIFIENRIRHLHATQDVSVRVVSPVPWFPVAARWAGRHAQFARVPRAEQRHGIDVIYPRFAVLPKVGMMLAPHLMAAAMYPVLRTIIADGFDFDVLDAYYFYPDGVAAARLGARLRKPVIITALGTDLNEIPRFALPRRMIVRAAAHAHGITTVSAALKARLVELGVDAARITPVIHGVDHALFCPPRERAALRARLGLQRRTLLSVGNLIALKGHHLAIEALAQLPECELLIAGDGPQRGDLERLAQRLGVAGRTRFLGLVAHERLPELYGAADALVLASSNEGMANVLIESLACGTPVLATRVGGSPEVVAAPQAGLLLDERSAAALVRAARALFADPPARAATRAYSRRFAWEQTAAAHMAVVRAALGPVPE